MPRPSQPLSSDPAAARVGGRVIVLDNAINHGNAFWHDLMGRTGVVLGIEADGMLTVSIDDIGVCTGVIPERFTFASPARKPWWRFW